MGWVNSRLSSYPGWKGEVSIVEVNRPPARSVNVRWPESHQNAPSGAQPFLDTCENKLGSHRREEEAHDSGHHPDAGPSNKGDQAFAEQ